MCSTVLSSSFRHDATYALIEFPLENISTTDITTLLNLPTLPADEPEIEYFDDKRLKIWASLSQQKILNQSSIQHYPGIDENAINWKEAKSQNYMDPIDGSDPDWTKYCDSNCWIARAKAMADKCAFPAEIKTYGKSVRGRDLIALKIGTKTTSKGPMLLGGNIHGDEPIGNQLIQRFAYETCNSASADQKTIAESTIVWYYPFFNPDGYESHKRENANGADLNRNFPVIKTPRAQVETTAYMNLAKEVKPSFSTMYHGGMAISIFPYFSCYDKTIIPKCPPGDVPSNHPRYADFRAAEDLYAAGMKKGGQRCDTSDCKFNVINNGGYPASGVLADWAAAKNNQVDLTIEVDRTKWPAGSTLPRYYKIHEPIISDYCKLSFG